MRDFGEPSYFFLSNGSMKVQSAKDSQRQAVGLLTPCMGLGEGTGGHAHNREGALLSEAWAGADRF